MVATMKPRPDIPKEAQRPFYKAVTFLKEAKDKSGYQLAIDSFREALSIAPWWPDAYYNLSKAQETAGQYDAAVQSMKLYLLTQPKAEDADEAEKALYALEAKQELEARAAREHEKKAEDISGMWRYAGGGPECWLFRINVTGSRLTITAFCGFESFPWATATVDGRNFEGSAIESMHGMAVRLKGKLNHDNNTITLEYETFDGSVRGTWKWERTE
jgi:tetratricopeptide (TPR) repeat protein